MSKITTFLLSVIAMIALLLVGFLGYILFSAFQADSVSTIGNQLEQDDSFEEVGTSKESNIGESELGASGDAERERKPNSTEDAAEINESKKSASQPQEADIDSTPLGRLFHALAEPAYVVLTYHHIDPTLKNNPITVTPELFEQHIRVLKRSEYSSISYNDLAQYLSIAEKFRSLQSIDRILTPTEETWVEESIAYINSLPLKGYHITFDDGYQSNYQYAYPVLRDSRIPATFFIIVQSSFKDSKSAPDWINYPHFTWDELRILQRNPLFQIQSHTYSLHSYEPGNGETIASLSGRIYRRDLGRVETHSEFMERIYQDMVLSRSYLENRLRPHTANGLSYPYGVYNEHVIEMAEKAGIQFLFTTQPGLVTYETELHSIPRLNAGAPNITSTELMNQIDLLFLRRIR